MPGDSTETEICSQVMVCDYPHLGTDLMSFTFHNRSEVVYETAVVSDKMTPEYKQRNKSNKRLAQTHRRRARRSCRPILDIVEEPDGDVWPTETQA